MFKLDYAELNKKPGMSLMPTKQQLLLLPSFLLPHFFALVPAGTTETSKWIALAMEMCETAREVP